MKALQQEYDRTVEHARAGGSLEEKKKVLLLIDQITEISKTVPKGWSQQVADMSGKAPTKMQTTKALLLKQVQKAEQSANANGETAAENQ